jgi:hypothetical protein
LAGAVNIRLRFSNDNAAVERRHQYTVHIVAAFIA